MKRKRTSFWCEDCRKPLCITPSFKIYHTEKDYKKHSKFYREMGDFLLAEIVDDGNESA